MKKYKVIAGKLERLDYRAYVKARIYLEIQDLDIDHDTFVETGYNMWSNSQGDISPEDIGIAIWYAIENTKEADPETVISLGLDLLRK